MLLNDAPHSVKVDEGRDENEFVITRHSQFEVPVNVLNMYGQQECRMKKEKIEEQWKEILEVISSIEQRKEHLLWIGDINRHLGSMIPGNDNKVSIGGKLLIPFLESNKYDI